jgi:hypothetical protein
LVLVAFVAAFIFDPEAVVRLVWACVTGNFGARVQIAGAAVLLSVAAVTVWAFRPVLSPSPGRDKSVRRRASRPTSGKDASTTGIKQREAATSPKRRTRNPSTPEVAVAPEAPEPGPKPPNARARPTRRPKAAGEAKTSNPGATRLSGPHD